ncbi:rhodanese-like domain-containing protein [Bacterioplanoides sp. SCSIO 12839]|uniref:rhodanese-like domain-containing protein n=1 Tax=Bacterioplanoides sp. SCSIO 12839 TaxID=2829569 RepID=UPI002107723E|nr:rhodanese-like domain-containing protein [Bacterioplanoides sp. SCSIO 12839]UTW48523.1 rhodanese-like domain-containing protein [Bacterioplanoides sp. SCSIO 12839]
MALTKEDFLAQARDAVNPVDGDAAEALLAQDGVVVLDVREPAEFDMGHLPGGVNVPRGLLEFMVGNHPALSNTQATVLLYCKNGGRSTLAAHTLKQMGFDQVKMLVGGFDGWQGSVHKVEVDPNIYQ